MSEKLHPEFLLVRFPKEPNRLFTQRESIKRGLFNKFIQWMANRLIVGEAQYGPGAKQAKYLTRLKLELKAYDENGNMEHLINIANYCILESCFPEHENHHHDPNVDSVTRGKV